MNDIKELLDEYFELGVAEGREGRDHDTPAGDAQRVRSAIDADLSEFGERDVGIKQLEWRRQGSTFIADTPFGGYQIDIAPYAGGPAYHLLHGDSFLSPHESEDDAFAAAQADYEARIRSALVPSSERDALSRRAAELEGALRELSEYIKFHKASVLDGMTKREMNALMEVLHRSNVALSQGDQP